MERRGALPSHHAACGAANARDVGGQFDRWQGIAGDRYMTGEGSYSHLRAEDGRHFWLGKTLLEGTRLVEPCRQIEKITGKAISKQLINRSGLYCKILQAAL
jgi:hypothetical protein